jgi:hypothetical protein
MRIAAHVRDASLANLGGEHRAKSVPTEPDGLVAFRSDNGYLTYIITTRRMTFGELLNYRNGLLMT